MHYYSKDPAGSGGVAAGFILPGTSVTGKIIREDKIMTDVKDNVQEAKPLVADAPVGIKDRIVSLDVLRGFAVFGILVMNIQAFSMIMAAYSNPAVYGGFTGINKWVWILGHVFFDLKFMGLFSMLFGAGIILITKKAESRGKKPAGIHFRRNFWLLIIGMMHGYLLWSGDILVIYAVCGSIVYFFRKISPKKLLIWALVFLAVSSAIYLYFGLSYSQWPEEAKQGVQMTWNPPPELVEADLAAYRGDWPTQMKARVPATYMAQTFINLIFFFWRCMGMMLIGMALFKWGILTAEKPKKFYLKLMALGFGIGIPVTVLGVIKNFAAKWDISYSMFLGFQLNYWASVLVSLGYIGLFMYLCKTGLKEKLARSLGAVGRMAFTNYLMQTVICTTIFYGHGFGLYGSVERKYQILIVFAILIAQVIISRTWLRYFKFGPAEWLWRSLNYLKRQPLRANP